MAGPRPPHPDQELLNVTQAGMVLGYSRWAVMDLIASGRLRRSLGGKNGRTTKVTRAAIQEYLASIEAPLPAKGVAPARNAS